MLSSRRRHVKAGVREARQELPFTARQPEEVLEGVQFLPHARFAHDAEPGRHVVNRESDPAPVWQRAFTMVLEPVLSYWNGTPSRWGYPPG